MGIYIQNKPVAHIYYHKIPILEVYIGDKQVWPGYILEVPSCYASGYWQDQYPWTEDTPWKD